jgi:circadian clock protein KaiB
MTVTVAPALKSKRGHESGPEWLELRLYVAGQTPKSLRAIDNLQRICDEELTGRYHIEIVDLVEHPQLARDAQIIAVPTLVRQRPQPLRKILGDLSDTAKVLVGLQIVSSS